MLGSPVTFRQELLHLSMLRQTPCLWNDNNAIGVAFDLAGCMAICSSLADRHLSTTSGHMFSALLINSVTSVTSYTVRLGESDMIFLI